MNRIESRDKFVVPEDLAAYIRLHGIRAWVADGRLYAEDRYTLDHVFHIDVVELTPTMSAVRAWLGY